MALNEEVYHLYRPDLEKPGIEEFKEVAQMTKLLPTPWVEPSDISAAVLFLNLG